VFTMNQAGCMAGEMIWRGMRLRLGRELGNEKAERKSGVDT
jgi:hypothetical protein